MFQGDQMVVDKVHFFNLPHCQIFNVSLYSTVISNGSTTLEWTELVTTKPNPNLKFTLDSFDLVIDGVNDDVSLKQASGKADGVIKAIWKHTHQCVDIYKMSLRHTNDDKDTNVGEISINSPSHLGESMEQDLHIFPGRCV